jgi:hypothetical protein
MVLGTFLGGKWTVLHLNLVPVNRGHKFQRWPSANNLPHTPHSAGAYGTGYILFFLKETSE